jgi:hypothetical protein
MAVITARLARLDAIHAGYFVGTSLVIQST